MGKKKALRINPDHSDETADWLKQLPQAKQDQEASAEAVRRLRKRRKDNR